MTRLTGKQRDPEQHWRFMSGFHIGADGDPYLDRLYIIGTPMFGVYLHRIHRSDNELYGHDHPWPFLSIVLSGAYGEQVWPDKHNARWANLRYRRRFSVARTPLRSAHRIDHVEGILWTLCLIGPRLNRWGFYPDGKFVPHERYPHDGQ